MLLLTTKLYRPQTDENWVPRPSLLARLHASLTHKLILLSAPPGFGKSTLVGQWLNQIDKASQSPTAKIYKVCWLSLDEGDNQLAQFLRYLIAAIRTCEPTACSITQSLLGVAQLPGVDYLADVVVSELSLIANDLVLVLDDYHLIRSHEVHQVMRHLLRYMPSRLHLVILSRTDPPLHLGRLRIEQQITELRAGDLRFAVAETRRFLHKRLDHALDDATLDLLHARTDGWITALQLSSIALQRQDPHQFLANFRGNDRLLVGYLVEEVMAQLAEPLREFLLCTALVDRFCASLADVLLADRLGPGFGQALMAQVEAQNLFVVPLDQTGEWVRYHDLFRDFLRHQLMRTESPATLARLHRIAGAWFAEAGLIEEALRHMLAAGDVRTATALVINQLHPMLDRQLPGSTLIRWLALFPADITETQPELLLVQIWLSVFGIGPQMPRARLADIEMRIQSDLTLAADQRQILVADLQLLRGVTAYWDGEPQRAVTLLQRALDQQLPTHQFAHAQVLIHLTAARTCMGETAVAHTLLRTALAVAQTQQRPTLMILLGGLAILHLHAGELAAAVEIAQQAVTAVDLVDGHVVWRDIGFVEIWYGWAQYLCGIAYYEQNELAAAAHHWRQVESMHYRTNPSAYQGSLLGLALVAQANGSTSESLAYTQAAREFVTEIRRPNLLAISAAFEVRLALLNGQTADADRLTQEITPGASQGTAIGVEVPLLTRIRALLAIATTTALTEALTFATTCLYHAERVHNTFQVFQISTLQALILHGLRRNEEAFDVLARALALGEPGGFVRTFVEFGAPMATLLRLFKATHGHTPYVHQLLAAFPPTYDSVDHRAQITHYAKLHGITPLTPRELDLLALIRQRLSNNEIATALVISPNTVKKHTNNIYTKLGVRNRREAVAKAEELSLLPPA
ncbi:AAA family ATPase [bacterium]|nr:AAA family ATPase [bacterium]